MSNHRGRAWGPQRRRSTQENRPIPCRRDGPAWLGSQGVRVCMRLCRAFWQAHFESPVPSLRLAARPVLNGLRQVVRLGFCRTLQVGHGARQLQPCPEQSEGMRWKAWALMPWVPCVNPRWSSRTRGSSTMRPRALRVRKLVSSGDQICAGIRPNALDSGSSGKLRSGAQEGPLSGTWCSP